MKTPLKFLGIIIGLLMWSCAVDEDSVDSTQKNLSKIVYSYPNGQIRLTENLVFDANDNLIEINNADGKILRSYEYNGANSLIRVVDYEYIENQSWFEIIKNISYNNENKISKIQRIFNVYESDGSLDHSHTFDKSVTYGTDFIRIVNNEIGNTTVEFTLSDDLITGAKIFKENSLVADMNFSYDANGNCVTGSGPYQPGLYDTNDISLSVSYGTEKKDPYFKAFFDFNILFYNESFFYLKEVLVEQQGLNYPTRIEWYQFENWINKDANNYDFDVDGYIVRKRTNIFTTNPAHIATYTWE